MHRQELTKHCKLILNSYVVKDRIVVLCEGTIENIVERSLLPDAIFYNRCVPRSWIGKPKPTFINCGNRNDVINAYFILLELAQTAIDEGNIISLSTHKLFAFVDLDIQAREIPNYHCKNIEEIFSKLYQENKVAVEDIAKHRIWVTGLIHKEAYFLQPCFQEFFNSYTPQPLYEGKPILLTDIYLQICADTAKDLDLKYAFRRVIGRIDYCRNLDCASLKRLQNTWQEQFVTCNSFQLREYLVSALLALRKAKPYWEKITFNPDNPNTEENIRFREQLSRRLAIEISRQDWHDCINHLAYWFKLLYRLA